MSFDFTSAIFLTFNAAPLDIAYARELTGGEVTGRGYKSGGTNAATFTGGRVKALGIDVTDEMRGAYLRLDEVESSRVQEKRARCDWVAR